MRDAFIIISIVAFRLAPFVVAGLGVWLALTRTAAGRALLARLRDDRSSSSDVLSLASEIERLERDLADVQERLNYAERLVIQQRSVLPPGAATRSRTPTPPDSGATRSQ